MKWSHPHRQVEIYFLKHYLQKKKAEEEKLKENLKEEEKLKEEKGVENPTREQKEEGDMEENPPEEDNYLARALILRLFL